MYSLYFWLSFVSTDQTGFIKIGEKYPKITPGMNHPPSFFVLRVLFIYTFSSVHSYFYDISENAKRALIISPGKQCTRKTE